MNFTIIINTPSGIVNIEAGGGGDAYVTQRSLRDARRADKGKKYASNVIRGGGGGSGFRPETLSVSTCKSSARISYEFLEYRAVNFSDVLGTPRRVTLSLSLLFHATNSIRRTREEARIVSDWLDISAIPTDACIADFQSRNAKYDRIPPRVLRARTNGLSFRYFDYRIDGYRFLILPFRLVFEWNYTGDVSPTPNAPLPFRPLLPHLRISLFIIPPRLRGRYAYELCHLSAVNYRFYSIHAGVHNYMDRGIVAWLYGWHVVFVNGVIGIGKTSGKE